MLNNSQKKIHVTNGCVALIVLIFFLLWITYLHLPNTSDELEFLTGTFDDPDAVGCQVVDVVFTWVNGSDPQFIKSVSKYSHKSQEAKGSALYQDVQTLKYAVRSVEAYVPWIRNIVLVTNGQVPNWLNLSAPRIKLITHHDMFSNTKYLPTFSSSAIESQFQNLDISECFFYLNDDTFFGNYVRKSDVFDIQTGQIAVAIWKNRFAPDSRASKVDWHRTIAYSNSLLNKHYHPDAAAVVKHPYASHVCHFFAKRILRRISKYWPEDWEEVSRNKFRNDDRPNTPFLHANIALKDFEAWKDYEEFFARITTDLVLLDSEFQRVQRYRPRCFCLNDGLKGSRDSNLDISAAINRTVNFLETFYPFPSSVEILGDNLKDVITPTTPLNSPTILILPFSHPPIILLHLTAKELRILLFLCWSLVMYFLLRRNLHSRTKIN